MLDETNLARSDSYAVHEDSGSKIFLYISGMSFKFDHEDDLGVKFSKIS